MRDILSSLSLYTLLPPKLKNPAAFRLFYLSVNISAIPNLKKNYVQLIVIASILGNEFKERTLSELYNRVSGFCDGISILRELINKEYFIKNEREEIEFCNKDFRQSIYSSIDKNTLETLHEVAGEVLESEHSSKSSKFCDVLIYHFENSGNRQKLNKYLWLGAQYYVSNFEYKKAGDYYFRLLNSADSADKKHDLIFKIAEIYRNAGEWDEEMNFLKIYLKQIKQINKHAFVLVRIANIYRLKSDYPTSQRILYKAAQLASKNNLEEISQRAELEQAKIKLNRGNHKEALKEFEVLITKTNGEILQLARAGKGITLAKLGRYQESIDIHKNLFEEAEEKKDKIKMTAALIDIGEGLVFKGFYNEAMDNFVLALRISQKTDRKIQQANCLGNIGVVHYNTGEFIKASRFFFRQSYLLIKIGNRSGVSRAFGMIGACMIAKGKYQKALKYLFLQLNLARVVKRKQTEAISLGNIGAVYNLMGKFNQALWHFRKQIILDEKLGNVNGIYRAMVNIGIQYYHLRKFKKAKMKFQEATKKTNKLEMAINTEITFGYYSAVLFELGKFDEAIKISELALEQSRKAKNNLMFIQSSIIREKSLNKKVNISLNNLIEKLKSYLLIELGKEEKALIYYELAKLRVSTYINMCLKSYVELYEQSPQFEFYQKIKELKSLSKGKN